jgi:acyl-coenzyme A thioesterase PaaI-like protein
MSDDELIVEAGDFARDTDVWPDESVAGRYHADLPEAWRVFYAFGGASMAVALRAAQRAIGRDDLHPITATAAFVSPVPCGPMVIDTEVLRDGRSAAQATATLRTSADANAGVHLTTVYGSEHPTHVDFVEAVWPDDVIEVDDTEEPPPPPDDSPFRNINYHQQTEWRPALRGMAFRSRDDWIPGPARSLSWHRLIKEPRLADGTIDPISLCAPADILGPALFSRLGPLGPDNPPFLVLSLEISIQFLAATTSPWILQHARVPHAAAGYAYSHVELWDADRRLVAIANQRGHVRPVPPDRFAQPDGTA